MSLPTNDTSKITRNQWTAVTVEDRLWQRTVRMDSGCWEYQGQRKGRMGYGSLRFEGRDQLAHRVAYQLVKGEIADDLVVMHECDNPPCVNPDHLRLGTVADNNADRDQKGRHVAPVREYVLLTHCRRGHPYDEENTGYKKTVQAGRRIGRFCKTCQAEAQRAGRARKQQGNA